MGESKPRAATSKGILPWRLWVIYYAEYFLINYALNQELEVLFQLSARSTFLLAWARRIVWDGGSLLTHSLGPSGWPFKTIK